jgi:uncharacterized protein
MKILVISDTHIPVAADALPARIEEEARHADVCLHAGDLINYEVFERLAQLTETYGVCGNMDDETAAKKLPQKQIIKLGEITIALTHGRGAPANVIDNVKKIFAGQASEVDIFIFGHSHMPCDIEEGGKIYFNPGSPTDKIFALKRTYGLLEINGKKIKRRILTLG